MRKRAQKMPPVCSHQWIDLVDLAMHRAMVRKIRREPRLFKRGERALARWQKARGSSCDSMREWKRILRDNDMETVLRILVQKDDEGDRLRSTSPFCDILTQREVKAIWAQYESK
jgi:hypothetical protein